MVSHLPFLSFVIPVKNDAVRLRRCLASVVADPYPAERREIVVVDNGSADDSPNVALEFGSQLLVVPGVRVAELRDRGAEVARGDILAFVDSDHELRPGWSRAAAETLSSQNAAAAGDLCHAPPHGSWVQTTYDAFRSHSSFVREVLWLGSGNLAIRRNAFVDARGFDTSLVTCEDVDLCQRLRREGYRILADPRMYSVHFGDPATLRQLFIGELWRGQDNLRVSFRGRLKWKEVPSIVLPVIQLASLAVIASVALMPLVGVRHRVVPAIAAALFLGLSSLRTLTLALNRRPRPWWRLAQYYCVASVYDLARALALVARRGHHRR